MKLRLENINTKVGKLADQSVELGEGNSNVTVIFESPSNMATVADIDTELKEVQNPTYRKRFSSIYRILSTLRPSLCYSKI